MATIAEQIAAAKPGQIRDAKGAPGLKVPGFTGQGWSSHETMLVFRWLLTQPDAWNEIMRVAREEPSNPHTVADTLHEHLVPRTVLGKIAAAGWDPAKVNWLEIAHELIERRGDPRPAQEHAGDSDSIGLAAGGPHVAKEAMHEPGLPVPDDKTAVAMFTAHRVNDILTQLAHAKERMQAARGTHHPEMRAYHAGHIRRHMASVLQHGHWLLANLRGHYPGEAAELDELKHHIGLARSLSPELKTGTLAHLTETLHHEAAHAVRHAEGMETPHPDDEWEFNADHAEKHLGGAQEHAGKIAEHLRDNYPLEAKWLHELDKLAGTAGEGGARQHARYAGAKDAKLANDGTIGAQLADSETAGA